MLKLSLICHPYQWKTLMLKPVMTQEEIRARNARQNVQNAFFDFALETLI